MCFQFCPLIILSSLLLLAVLLFLIYRVVRRNYAPSPKLWCNIRLPRLVPYTFWNNRTLDAEDAEFRVDLRELKSNNKGRSTLKERRDSVVTVSTAINATAADSGAAGSTARPAAAGYAASYAASDALAANDEANQPYFGFEFG